MKLDRFVRSASLALALAAFAAPALAADGAAPQQPPAAQPPAAQQAPAAQQPPAAQQAPAAPAAQAAVQQGAAGTETAASFLVSVDWLKANLGNVLIIDARDQSLYKGQQGHIPGAVNAPPSYFANMGGKSGDPTWHTVVDAATLAKKLGALGVDGKRPVVVYGDGGDWGNAAWVVWIMRMAGNKNARMLDGGWTLWRASGAKADHETHAGKAAAHPAIKIDQSYTVTTDWMKENYRRPDVKIVDVRMDREYTGQIRPFGEKRPGHIPGAVHFPMDNVLALDFTLLPAAELEAKMLSAFPNKAQEIILYDTNGVRSAFMTMAFRLAGYPNARNYDASYSVWCAADDTEITQGPNP